MPTNYLNYILEAEKDIELKAIAEKDLAVLQEQIGDLRKTVSLKFILCV
jgi:hypothetical protein